MLISRADANEIVAEQYNNIYSFCLSKLKSKEDADDVTQEVFLLFQTKLVSLENINIRSWLYSVANRKIMEQYRSRMLKSKLISYEDDCFEQDSRDFYEINDSLFIQDDEIESIKARILKRLSPEEQQLFIKIYESRMKYADIGKELNISEKAVSMRALRMRVKIKKMAELAFMALAFLLAKWEI